MITLPFWVMDFVLNVIFLSGTACYETDNDCLNAAVPAW